MLTAIDRTVSYPVTCLGGSGDVEIDQRHRALAGDAPQERAAPADHGDGIGQVEGPGHVGGGDLTHAVADDGVGHDAPRPPLRRQAHLDGEEEGLDDVDVVDPLGSPPPPTASR